LDLIKNNMKAVKIELIEKKKEIGKRKIDLKGVKKINLNQMKIRLQN